jgi:hypothetical protein
MATNAHPRVADLHNTHYILPERRQNRKAFCFLLGEKPKMATNAHPRVVVYSIHTTFCLRGDNRKFFCFLLGEKPRMASNAHPRGAIYTIHITSCQRGSFLFAFRRKTNAHVAQINTIHITSCQRGDRTGRFSVFF